MRDLGLPTIPPSIPAPRRATSAKGQPAPSPPPTTRRRSAGLAGGLQGGLEVNPIRTTRLVEIAYRSRSPELAAKVANGFADAYIDWGIETRTRVAGQGVRPSSAHQIETLKQEIQDKENQLQAYSRRTDIVSLDPATNVTLKRLEALNQDYIGAVSERINREARLNELQSATGDRAADVLADPLLAEQRSQLLELEREYATKLNTYKPEWPAMHELKAQDRTGAAEPEDGHRRTRSCRRATSARGEVPDRCSAASRPWIAQLNQIKAENRQLELGGGRVQQPAGRDLDPPDAARRAGAQAVRDRRRVAPAGDQESNVRIVDRALVPGGPFRPSLRRSVTIGLGAGLASSASASSSCWTTWTGR